MAKEVPLYKDKKYVKLLETVLKKLKTGFENKETYSRESGKGGSKLIALPEDRYNRVVNALITQPDKGFVDILEKHKNFNAAQLAQLIKTREDTLLNKGQPIVGTEGHHIFHQNTVKRIRHLPIAK